LPFKCNLQRYTAEKSRMKGKNRVSKRYRKKQQNVVDDKKLRAKVGLYKCVGLLQRFSATRCSMETDEL
jgi:hypothetical protein